MPTRYISKQIHSEDITQSYRTAFKITYNKISTIYVDDHDKIMRTISHILPKMCCNIPCAKTWLLLMKMIKAIIS